MGNGLALSERQWLTHFKSSVFLGSLGDHVRIVGFFGKIGSKGTFCRPRPIQFLNSGAEDRSGTFGREFCTKGDLCRVSIG